MDTSGACVLYLKHGVCGKPGRSCARCMSVYYCSKEHQVADLPRHRPSCIKPFRLVQEPSKKPYLVATRDIEKGTRIMRSQAIVVGPSGSKIVCLGCLRPSVYYDVMAYQCEGCGWPVCNYDCQSAPMHQAECSAMQKAGYHLELDELQDVDSWKAKFPFIGLWLMVLRCLLLPTSLKEKLKKIKIPKDCGMISPSSPFWSPAIGFIKNTLKLSKFDDVEISHMGFLVLFGGVQFPIQSLKDGHSIFELREACGIHISDAIHLEHSCNPNVEIIETIQDAKNLQIVSVRTIQKGERLTAFKQIGSPFDSTVNRHIKAALTFFSCSCERCIDPSELGLYLDSIRCKKCLDIDKDSVSMVLPMHPGANILISPWICESCGFKTSSSDIMSIMTDMSMKLKLVVENKKENGSEIVEFIQTHTGPKGILHPKNHIILSAKNAYCETCFQNSTDKGAMFTIGSKSLARFYTYSSDLMEVSRIIFNRDYDWPYFRLKMMSSRSIIRDWVRGTTSKKKAMKLLKAENLDFINKPRPAYVSRDMHILIRNLLIEFDMHKQRLYVS